MPAEARSAAKEINQQFRDASGLFVLEPMRGIGESEELRVRAIAQAFARHFRQKEGVALAPEDARGDADGFVWKFDASAEEGAIPVDHAGEGAGLGPSSAILGEVVLGESAGAAGTQKGSLADAEVECGEEGFGQPGKLEEKHIPTAEELTRTRAEEFSHHRGMRDVEHCEL